MERIPYGCRGCSYDKVLNMLRNEIENELKVIMNYKKILRLTVISEDKKLLNSIVKCKEKHLIELQLLHIKEITGEAVYEEKRQVREFTLQELSQYDGSNGKAAYVAVEGRVYDVSNSAVWGGGTHFGLYAGKDLTVEFETCHKEMNILSKLEQVGIMSREQK